MEMQMRKGGRRKFQLRIKGRNQSKKRKKEKECGEERRIQRGARVGNKRRDGGKRSRIVFKLCSPEPGTESRGFWKAFFNASCTWAFAHAFFNDEDYCFTHNRVSK